MSNEEESLKKLTDELSNVEVEYAPEASVLELVLSDQIPEAAHPLFKTLREERKDLLWSAPVHKDSLCNIRKFTASGILVIDEPLKWTWGTVIGNRCLRTLIAWRMCALARISHEIDETMLTHLDLAFGGE